MNLSLAWAGNKNQKDVYIFIYNFFNMQKTKTIENFHQGKF